MIPFFKRFFSSAPLQEIPPIWIIALIAGFPILSETMYTPALPNIARSLNTPSSWVEYTMSIYFAGTAFGVIFWGRLSDRLGRRPILMIGFFIYIIGCLGCFLSTTIVGLFLARIVQSLGGSVGVVLGQAIAHDVFKDQKRGKIFSTIGSVLSLAPAVGAMMGGAIDERFGWSFIFIVLMLWGVVVACLAFQYLPETRGLQKDTAPPISHIIVRMLKDPKVIVCSLTMGLSNGLLFSYNSEGPFYLINMLGLTPFLYGAGFSGLALTGALGSYCSKRMHNRMQSAEILKIGQLTIFIGALLFFVGTLILYTQNAHHLAHIALTFFCMLIIALGRGLTVANSLSLALEGYHRFAGTASSLFVCSYYVIISMVTALMGMLHNGTLIPMPVYFCFLGGLLLIVRLFVPTKPQDSKKIRKIHIKI